ncbi:alpha/beta-hydrolase [Tilletiaria anomala UBC 951]|uniref:Alpha/beta-hydrolase n=1 Tax=Tilletiaria anomala (strain ATCC 24038 / CBS 436.72 / UBC 951) TaxID=1037660 RepID=A0A066WFM5_TILAU|nr:alpha/beta-hydrolase [Tilletiaria anomala UBC 951]KDN52777.1 alpha/beta-hydrolase [Tilletiaria anomala UBC 951]
MPTERSVRAEDGATIWYEVHAPANLNNACNVPLVLIMGMAGIGRDFYPLAQLLARTREVIIVDNRGIGNSKFPDDWDGNLTLQRMALDVLCVVRDLGKTAVDMLGWSMGGFIVQILLTSPEARTDSDGKREIRGVKIRKAILAATAAKRPHVNFDPKALAAAAWAIKDEDERIRKIKNEFFKLQYYPEWIEASETNRNIIQHRIDMDLKVDRPAEVIGLQIAACARLDMRPLLSSIPASLPILLIHGERDCVITYAETRDLEQGIQHAEWLDHPELGRLYGHWFFDFGKDGADGWAKAIVGWLDGEKAKL